MSLNLSFVFTAKEAEHFFFLMAVLEEREGRMWHVALAAEDMKAAQCKNLLKPAQVIELLWKSAHS